jgi:hypothetical protein
MTASRLLCVAQDDSSVVPELALLWPLLGRRIAFHRRLVNLTHSVKAAVLLSQVIYWTRHGRDIGTTGGWFYKTIQQWEIETGLTVKEQRTARHSLCDLGLLQQSRRGIPAVLYFRLEATRLASLLSACVGRSDGDLDWSDGTAVIELLGAPVAYHCTLADVTGSVHAGLMLSRALYLTRYSSRGLSGGWFYAPMAFWLDETGLGRWEQQTARRDLTRLDLWDEQTRGIPRIAVIAGTTTHGTQTVFALPEYPCMPRWSCFLHLGGGNSSIKVAGGMPSGCTEIHKSD